MNEQSTTVAFRYTATDGLQDIAGGRVANGVNDREQITGNTDLFV